MHGRLLIDEMFPREAADALRTSGHDAVSAHEVCPGSSEPAVWALAVDQDRAVVTENLIDFRPLLAEALRDGQPAVPLLCVRRRGLPRGGALAVSLARRLDRFLSSRDTLPATELWP